MELRIGRTFFPQWQLLQHDCPKILFELQWSNGPINQVNGLSLIFGTHVTIRLDAHWSLLGFIDSMGDLSNHEKYIFIGETPEICKDDSPAQSSGPSLACFTPTTFLVNCIACTSHDGEPTAVSQQSLSKLPVVAKTTFDRLWPSTMK